MVTHWNSNAVCGSFLEQRFVAFACLSSEYQVVDNFKGFDQTTLDDIKRFLILRAFSYYITLLRGEGQGFWNNLNKENFFYIQNCYKDRGAGLKSRFSHNIKVIQSFC